MEIILRIGIASTLGVLSMASAPARAQEIRIDGSSTVFPLTEAVAEEFARLDPSFRVTVSASGTGGGFKKFVVGETDISNASRPIKASERAVAARNGVRFIELPVAYDALAIVAHPRNTWCADITTAELRRIWKPGSNVRFWSQVRAGWPRRPIKLYGAGTDSGTFDYFTQAIVGQEGASRRDYVASENDNTLVQGVSRDPNSLGYFGLAPYQENKNKLKVLKVGGVAPSAQTVANGTYKPLSRPLFLYVSGAAASKPHVASFVRFYLQNASLLSPEIGFVGLPDSLSRLVRQRFDKKTTGSLFDGRGTAVGARLGDLLRRAARER